MKRFRLTRTVTKKECSWLDRDYRYGEILFEYAGHTYGCISPDGTACSERPGEPPFVEIPNCALQDTDIEVKKTWHFVSDGNKSHIIHDYRDNIKTMSDGGPWQMISSGSDIKEDLIEKQGILPDPCIHCGDLISTSYHEPLKSELIKDNICHSCHFWLGHAKNAEKENIARIDGKHYMYLPETDEGFRGFGGRRFDIEFFDGRKVTTTNLWHQGTIPERFKKLMPDNAKFVQP